MTAYEMKRQLIHSLAEIWSDHHDETEHSDKSAMQEDMILSDAKVYDQNDDYDYHDAVWYSI